RLSAYWQARDRFLALGVATSKMPPITNPITELSPKLLDIVRISPDFDSAYRPLLAMARELAQNDGAGGRELLSQLDSVAPSRSEAREMLASVDEATP